jgi:hypothetical protein
MAEEPMRRRPRVVASDEPSLLEPDRALGAVLRVPDELRPLPAWTDLALVLAVCVPFWAGLTWLISAWL